MVSGRRGRATAPSGFCHLPEGQTRYEWSGCGTVQRAPSSPGLVYLGGVAVIVGQTYGLRLRHVVAAAFYPDRERARAAWLHSHLLSRRTGWITGVRRALRLRWDAGETRAPGLVDMLLARCVRHKRARVAVEKLVAEKRMGQMMSLMKLGASFVVIMDRAGVRRLSSSSSGCAVNKNCCCRASPCLAA